MTETSVIIPTYNGCHLLKMTLSSYLAQKNVKEIIIVDDASVDRTEYYIKELMSKEPLIKYVKLNRRGGPSAAREAGLSSASGDYVLFGQDDIVLKDDYLQTLCILINRLNVDIICGKLYYMKKEKPISDCSKHQKGYNKTYDLINKVTVEGNFAADTDGPALFLHACSLFKKDVLKRIKYDKTYSYNYFREETDVFLQARIKGFQAFFTAKTECFHLPLILHVERSCFDREINSTFARFFLRTRDYLFRNIHVPSIRAVYCLTNWDDDIMRIMNNNYFLDKFFYVLRKEFDYNHDKEYYKFLFALHLAKDRLFLLKDLLNSLLKRRFG